MKNLYLLPKEKPKQELRKVCKCKRAYENPLSEICSLCWNELYPNEKDEIKDEDLLEEAKQETLEEVAKKYSENWEETTGLDYENTVPSEVNKLDFINGAKWQQKQNKNLYNEEEVHEIILSYQNNVENSPNHITYNEWFEQFKKK